LLGIDGANAQLHLQPQRPVNVRQAIASYRQILRQDPTHAEASERVAEVYLQTGLPGEAELILRRWLKAEGTPRGRLLLSMVLEAQRKFKEAASELQSSIEKHPDYVAAYQRLADLMLRHPDEVPGQPEQLLRQAIKANPDSAQAYIALGTFLQQRGRGENPSEQAKTEYLKALDCDLADPSVRVYLAQRLLSVGEYARAEEQLTQAADSDPRVLLLWQTWAALTFAKRSPEEAGALADRALRGLGPEAFPFLATAADLFLYGKNEERAKACLEQIQKADPGSPAIPELQGKLADYRGNPRAAIRYWQKAIADRKAAHEKDDAPQLRLLMAQAYERAGDLQAAIRELRSLTDRYPRSAPARFLLARVLERVGAWREASVHVSEAVRLDPKNLEARVLDLELRARLAAVQGEVSDDSRRQLDAEVDALCKEQPRSLLALLCGGNVALALRDADRTDRFARTLQDQGFELQGALLAARALLLRGEREQAAARLKDVVGKFPGRVSPALQLANLLLRMSQADGAVKALKEAAQVAKGKARWELLTALAGLHYRLGDVDKAKGLLEQLASEDPEDINARVMLLNVLGTSDLERSQQLVGEIKNIEGPGGFHWRYQQARLWLSSPDWQERMPEVLELLNANIGQDPWHLGSRLLLGVAHEQAGNLRLAVEAYRRAYELNPSAPATVVRLIGALQKTNELDEASRVLDDAARRGVSAQRIAGLRLRLQQRSGQLDEAVLTAEECDKGNWMRPEPSWRRWSPTTPWSPWPKSTSCSARRRSKRPSPCATPWLRQRTVSPPTCSGDESVPPWASWTRLSRTTKRLRNSSPRTYRGGLTTVASWPPEGSSTKPSRPSDVPLKSTRVTPRSSLAPWHCTR